GGGGRRAPAARAAPTPAPPAPPARAAPPLWAAGGGVRRGGGPPRRDGVVHGPADLGRAAEHVDEVDLLRDVAHVAVHRLSEDLRLARVDGNDGVAALL